MAIKPAAGKIFIKLNELKAGALDVTNQNMLSEQGKVVAVGEGVASIKIGDEVVVKIWGCDHASIDNEDYYVTDITSKAILCVIE